VNRRLSVDVAAFGWILIAAAGCGAQAPPGPPLRVERAPAATAARASAAPRPGVEALLPQGGGALAPSLVALVPPAPGDGAGDAEAPFDLTSDAGCAGCHAEVAEQWRASAHAFASFDNPIYRASVDGFRTAVGFGPSRFCGGCHDPALLVDGGMDQDVAPDDPRAHAGVGCLVCHGIVEARRDGNASYRLRRDPVPLPREGDAASLERHRARVAPPALRSVELCASCHRAFLGAETGQGHHLPGADDYGPWLRSAWSGSRLERIDEAPTVQDCRGCHMPAVPATRDAAAARDGSVRSHRAAGGHRWLAAMTGDGAQDEVARAVLEGAARIDVVAFADCGAGLERIDRPDRSIAGCARLVLDVVVRNERVGHHFPGGTRDAHDTWIELAIVDARGRLVAGSAAPEGDVHRLLAVVVDDRGEPVRAREVERFRAVAYDQTVPPRDAVVVRYELPLDPALDGGVRVTARVQHRSRSREVQAAACRAHRSERGARFARAARAFGRPSLDPCRPQPTTLVAERTVAIGAADSRASPGGRSDDRAAFERLLWHGRGWRRALGEELDVARPSLLAAANLAATLGPEAPRLRAMAELELAHVAARQGRVEEALGWAASAEKGAPAHPAIAWARGVALSAVWRWQAAAAELARAAAHAPNDERAWSELAVALGSLGRAEEALVASRAGLALGPRHPDLLRVQALALRELAAPPDARDRAFAAFLGHRPRDDAPGLRARCSSRVPGCARERIGVHRHELTRYDGRR
jgi:hypothetical protein